MVLRPQPSLTKPPRVFLKGSIRKNHFFNITFAEMLPGFSAPAGHVQPEVPWVRADLASGARLRSPRRADPRLGSARCADLTSARAPGQGAAAPLSSASPDSGLGGWSCQMSPKTTPWEARKQKRLSLTGGTNQGHKRNVSASCSDITPKPFPF